MKLYLRCIALTALILAVATASAEEFRITTVEYEIEGRTREYFLAEVAEIELGKVFPDRASLDAYIADKTQVLLNERVLETAEIEVSVGEASAGEAAPVRLLVKTKDTWNLILLPYFKYDSNSGLLLAGRGRDYNFLGTMTPFILDLNWRFDPSGAVFPSVEASFDVPFRAAGLTWKWSIGLGLTLIEGGPADASVTDWLTLYLPAGSGNFGILLHQALHFNDRDSTGAYYDDHFYAKAGAKAFYEIDLAELGPWGKLSLTPFLAVLERFAPGGLVDPSLDLGYSLTPGLDLSLGRVDWIGNFRRGIKGSLSADLAYYPLSIGWDRTLKTSLAAYGVLGLIGPSARLSGLFSFDGLDTSAGDALRGILDARVDTDAALFLNLDLPVRVLVFEPAKWFGKSWMRYFHFEQQWSAFLDLGLGHFGPSWFNPSEGWYSGGLEIITYPSVARSFYLRISAGFDLNAVLVNRSLSSPSPRDGQPIREFFFGFGHHY